MPRLISSLLLPLLIASSASAVTMAWTPIGNPGNPADTEVMTRDGTTGYGSVPYAYSIGTYEVTNAQYAEFLNAKARSDPFFLYDTRMGNPGFSPSNPLNGAGGITRSGSEGSYAYTPITGRENIPVFFVSFFDALRFANWMNNGQGSGNTETGAYTLLGSTSLPSNWATVTRAAEAAIVLPTENEWYKAAYYDATTTTYFNYPAHSDTQTRCVAFEYQPNQAACDYSTYGGATVGSYIRSPSPYGTFDQGGNASEWNEANIFEGYYRGIRGGGWTSGPGTLSASYRDSGYRDQGEGYVGFRLALIPEPGTGLLVIAGLLGLAGWRRSRA